MIHRWRWWIVLAIAVAAAFVFWPRPIAEERSPDSEATPPAERAATTTDTAGTEGVIFEDGAEPESNDLNQQAMNAWYAGDIQDAMAIFEEAIEAAPDDPAPHTNYGRLLTLMVAYDKALPLLQRANELKPDDAQTWLDLATLYERAQLFRESREAHAEAVRIVGADAIVRDEQARFVVKGDTLW